jgi:hypothetical protein
MHWDRETAIIEGNVIATFYALKFPRQCTIILLVKVVWRPGEMLGSEEGNVTGSGLFWVWMRIKSLSSTVLCLIFHINVLKGCILLKFMIAFRELHSIFWHHNPEVCNGAKIVLVILRFLHKNHVVEPKICVLIQYLLYSRGKCQKNLNWFWWLHDLLDAYWPSASSLVFEYASPSGHPCTCSCLNKRG